MKKILIENFIKYSAFIHFDHNFLGHVQNVRFNCI